MFHSLMGLSEVQRIRKEIIQIRNIYLNRILISVFYISLKVILEQKQSLDLKILRFP